jgi:hypothetical protein
MAHPEATEPLGGVNTCAGWIHPADSCRLFAFIILKMRPYVGSAAALSKLHGLDGRPGW